MNYVSQSLYIHTYIQSIWLQVVLERSRRSTWRHLFIQLIDALGGHCGEKFCFSAPLRFNLAEGSRSGPYGNTGVTETDRATCRGGGSMQGSIKTSSDYTKCTQSIFPSIWSHALLLSVNRSSQLMVIITAGYPFIYSRLLFLCSIQDLLFSHIPFGCQESSANAPHCDHGNCKMYLEAMIVQVRRCTWRPRSGELRDTMGCQDQPNLEMHFEAEIK